MSCGIYAQIKLEEKVFDNAMSACICQQIMTILCKFLLHSSFVRTVLQRVSRYLKLHLRKYEVLLSHIIYLLFLLKCISNYISDVFFFYCLAS